MLSKIMPTKYPGVCLRSAGLKKLVASQVAWMLPTDNASNGTQTTSGLAGAINREAEFTGN
jgi:hypothetical protein